MLAPGAIPTVDFYLTPRLAELPAESVFWFDSQSFNPEVQALQDGAFVVIVRHAGARWLSFLAQNRARWSGVAFLADDDIPGAWRCPDVPLDYGLWTTGRYLRVRRALVAVCDRIWVSTAALQQRYAGVATRVVPPLDFSVPREAAPPGTRAWAYHGTRIHSRELRWLASVVNVVQRTSHESEFEVFGNERIAKLFAPIPRVRVFSPRPWPEYLAHCRASNLAVAVAPLFSGRFNAVRSHAKIFDITRCGAVGVCSNRDPYASALDTAGVSLLPDDPRLWANEILRLLGDDALRLERYRKASAWAQSASRGSEIGTLIRAGSGAG